MQGHLDFTIDFETCSLSADAAVMQAAVVPWLRDGEETPFFGNGELEPYVGYVDLRTCVVEGFDFDSATIRWWSERDAEAKEAVTEGLPEPVSEVLQNILDYILRTAGDCGARSICLWCQGPDVDIAILRSLCRRFGRDLETTVRHTSFRDCRTVILEEAVRMSVLSLCSHAPKVKELPLPTQILENPSLAYDIFGPLPDGLSKHVFHDAFYDALRSTWYTWKAMRWMLPSTGTESL